MRSSNKRSRNKNNRNRPSGNIVNRVFDSSGPEGKVRGTPQQIIDKYNQLARDAQLANDRVATENFQQHAEHYLRMLAEAQREQAERQAQNQQNQQNNSQQNQQNNNQQNAQNDQPGGGDQPGGNDQGGRRNRGPRNQPRQDRDENPQPAAGGDVIDMDAGGDSGLVETPEEKPKRSRKPKKAEVEAEAPVEDAAAPDAAE